MAELRLNMRRNGTEIGENPKLMLIAVKAILNRLSGIVGHGDRRHG